MAEVQQAGAGGGIGAGGVNHVAHLGGALCGVLLIAALSRLSAPPKGGS